MKSENVSFVLFNIFILNIFENIDSRYSEIIFPLNTKRRVSYNRLRKGVKIVKEKGWHQLILRYKQYRKSQRKPQQPIENYQRQYIENVFKSASQKSDEYVSVSTEAIILTENDIRLIAFYLPQYHPIPENDRWWGRGFTDWTNVSKAVPQYAGHYQPHLPDELGFYDLRLVEVQQRQVELAKQYGIYGFCFHYYWFNGKRLLEKPLNQFLEHKELDMPFCLCWANENWTRRWDGLEKDILLEQIHSPENDINFIRDLKSFFADSRYIRIEGKPVLIVYRVTILPDPKATAERWRAYCRDQGIGEIYLIAAQTFGLTNPGQYGFDAAVEFPPHTMADCEEITYGITILNNKYSGKIWDYDFFVKSKEYLKNAPFTLFKGIAPGWDNTARKPHNSSIYQGSSPSVYKEWLLDLINWTYKVHSKDYRFIFINAWNEWAEGAHLEPDRKYGYGYLQSTADAIIESRIREKTLKKADSPFIKKFGRLSDNEWFEFLKSTVQNPVIDGIKLPGFPDTTLQTQFVGSANENALGEAYLFYTLLKQYSNKLGIPLNHQSKVLDFGVGWGRILRFFLKDIEEYNLFGVDVDPDIIEICKNTGMPGVYGVVPPIGPTDFEDNSFDLIYAYSVFSHLSERIHLEWIKELSRILKPGGIFIATTEACHFIDFCTSLMEETIKSDWHKALSTAFPNPTKALEAYERGEFIFVPTGGGGNRDASFYGEAVISKLYVERYWTKYFNLCEFIDDKNRFWQAVIVMQKPKM